MKKEKSQIISTIKKVMPSVVSVIVLKNISDIKKDVMYMSKKKGKKMRVNIPDEKIDINGMVQVGGGSGFVVDKSGIILTNKHVINEPNASYGVITSDEKKYDAKIVASDPINDLSVLRINPKNELKSVTLGNSKKLELGQTVLAFGNALGIFKNTVSQGIISGLSRYVSAKSDGTSKLQELRGLIQTDAAINPGNSGGPLVDVFGNVIGVNAAIVSGAENISFAIPISAGEKDLKDLKKYGYIRRPLIGIRYMTINSDIKEKMNMPVDYGAFVTKEHFFELAVIPKSPAEKAGIKEKDIILKWNNQKVTEEKTIQDFLEDSSIGETVKITVLRGKKMLEKKVKLSERK